MKKNHFFLIIILIIGLFLRIHKLSTLPPGLTWDEAGLGYNAYSILKTAHDEHGALLPLTFKSFGDYKPGLYVYFAVPSIAVFGLNEFATRLPSVIAGVLAIYGIYLLTRQLFNKNIAIFSALFLAISPWHIHFSRGAWEVNVFTTILLFAVYFFLKSLSNPKYFLHWITLSVATFLTYQGAKMLTPLIFLSLFIIYFFDIKKTLSRWFVPISHRIIFIFLGLFLTLLFVQNLTGPAGNRLTRLSVFGYRPDISGNKIFDNQFNLTSKMIISRYLYHFSPEVLFYQGSVISPRGHLPEQGVLYLTDAFFLMLGFTALAQMKIKKSKYFLFALFLLSPLPASLTLAEFSTIRALPLVIPLSIISALGFNLLFTKFSKIIGFLLLGPIIVNTILTLNIYFNHSSEALAPEFNYGYRQVFEQIKSLPDAKKIIFTDVYGQPYIYYLFYTHFDPASYQKLNAYIDQGIDVGRVDRIGDKIEFHQFGYGDMLTSPNTWFVGSVGNITDNFDPANNIVDYYSQIKLGNSSPVFRLVKTK